MKIEFSDWLQIQETLARYNRHLDDRDWNAFGDVFTEDAEASYEAGKVLRGRAAIVEYVKGVEEAGFRVTEHLGSTFTFDLIEPDRVRTEVPGLGFGVTVEGSEVDILFVGYRYADEIVRDGDRWRIRQRTYSPVFTSHGPHAAPPVPE
jgi:hypothetical protein